MGEKSEIKLLHGVHLNRIIQGVGLRAYPLVAPSNATNDYIVYQRTGMDHIESKGRLKVYPTEATYTISIVSDEYGRSLSNAEILLSALTDYHDAEVNDIQVIDCSESFSDDFFIQTLQIKIILN